MGKIFKALRNLGKIKEYVFALFFIVIKIKNVVAAIEGELDNTKLGKKLKEYLPRVKKVLDSVIDIVKRVLDFMGVDVDSEVPVESLSVGSLDDELADLEDTVNKLGK